jgi:hypothetical protein
MKKTDKTDTIKKEVELTTIQKRIIDGKKRFIEHLNEDEVCGNVTIAARRTKVTRETLYQWKRADKIFSDEWDRIVIETADTFADEAEFSLRAQVIKGVPTSTIFVLKNLRPGKWKEKQDHSGEVKISHKVSPRFAKVLRKLTDDKNE